MNWIVAGLIAGVGAFLADWVMWGKVVNKGLEQYGTMPPSPEEGKKMMAANLPKAAVVTLVFGVLMAWFYARLKGGLWGLVGDLDFGLIGVGIVDHRPESAVAELLETGCRLPETQQPLRGHHDERPGGCVQRLAPDQVEELRRGRAVRGADVLLRGELEEPLQPCARVLGAVSLVAVRQQECQA